RWIVKMWLIISECFCHNQLSNCFCLFRNNVSELEIYKITPDLFDHGLEINEAVLWLETNKKQILIMSADVYLKSPTIPIETFVDHIFAVNRFFNMNHELTPNNLGFHATYSSRV